MNAVAVVDRQREELEELRETIVQLRDALAPQIAWPCEWRLTSSEAVFLSSLYAAKGMMSRERLMTAVYGAGWELDPKILDVMVCRIRRKVPFAADVRTHRGQGFALGSEARTLIRDAIRAPDIDQTGGDAVAGKKQINILIDEIVHTRIAAAAKTANMPVATYAKVLFEAAYSARCSETGDRDLDASVAGALILSGAELDSDQISRALKISEATVDKILQAWRGQERETA